MRIAFLFGAGISEPAGMPKTQDITEKVLTGSGFTRHTDTTYILHSPLLQHHEYVPKVLEFLKHLKNVIDQYYVPDKTGRYTNYEDLYYLATQIHDSEIGEYDNPAVQPLIDKISSKVSKLFAKNDEYGEIKRLIDLAREATNYIADITWHLLSQKPNQTEHLNNIRDACLDKDFLGINIFTLNHDTILDKCLSQGGIKVIDGFGEPNRDMRYWTPEMYETNLSKIRLYKLHGSVNWFRLSPISGSWYEEKVGIPLDGDPWHRSNPQDRIEWPSDGRPMLLIGTFNKMLRYMSGIFAELHYRFYTTLKDVKFLIVSGYGFRDKGINTRILNWIYSNQENRIIIIHPDPEELKEKSRDAVYNKLDGWIKQNTLKIIQSNIEDTTWEDIKKNLV